MIAGGFAMKMETFVELDGNQVDTNKQNLRFKEIWKEQGFKVKDLEDVSIYINLNQNKVFYVANGDISGSFDIVE